MAYGDSIQGKGCLMGYDRKYGKVTTEHGDIPDDEPVIVFRARDKETPALIHYYAGLCRNAGSPAFHVDLVTGTARKFREWQLANPGQVRIPDSAAHRERLEAQDRSQDYRL